MKKLIAIVLLSLYLVSTTELYQFLKIPTLIEHYWEHKNLNPEMTLIAFLKTHYDHPVKDKDYTKDRKLPFVIHTTPLALVFTINKGFIFEFKNGQPEKIRHHKIPSYDEDFCYKGYLNSVWEPPKFSFL
ncbi:hypothetical protein SAMN05880574_10143 [Chryseobacterium sp. RU37D]|uniref:hypothetical protein n=1 Tax=Chryseobacterium sp. RU37D TaxID=1907397 RepID=UPI0009574AA5|nr:hypothetical protein [Chryseobacterium sp. RU37D]SIP86290.1 hypothetical protein SAMN05880574_10143 [Chryseobacterium sp. RU37D]